VSLLHLITQATSSIGRSWFDFKAGLEALAVIQDQALHVLAGVLLQLLFAALVRRPISSFLPWWGVVALELANEWADIRFSTWPGADAQYRDSLVDLLVTVALPTVLLVISRRYPGLLTRQGSRG
jgi:hypothetical protein